MSLYSIQSSSDHIQVDLLMRKCAIWTNKYFFNIIIIKGEMMDKLATLIFSLKKSRKLQKLQEVIAPPGQTIEQAADSMYKEIKGDDKNEKALNAFWDLCENDENISNIMIQYKKNRNYLQDTYSKLCAMGLGQWINGHFLALSTLAYPEPLKFVIESENRKIPYQNIVSALFDYWETNISLKEYTEKPKKKEDAIAAQFIIEINEIVKNNFPDVVLPGIKEILGRGFNNESEQKHAIHAFYVAILFVEMQAISNLLSPIQAKRIKKHLANAFVQIDKRKYGYLTACMSEYQCLWDMKLAQHQPPLDVIVSKLVPKMGFRKSKVMSFIRTLKFGTSVDNYQMFHIHLSILDSMVTFLGQLKWWKKAIEQYNIVK